MVCTRMLSLLSHEFTVFSIDIYIVRVEIPVDAHVVHPTHSTEIFPDAEDVNTVESARKSLIETRKLLHEIRKRLIDGIPYESRSYSPVRKKAQAWGSAQSNWTSALTSAKKKLKNATRRARHADNKSDVSTSIDKKGSASPHAVAERKVESSTAFSTSMRSTEALPKPAKPAQTKDALML